MAKSKAKTGNDLVLVGRVLGPHGVRGLLRVQCFGDDPVTLIGLGPLVDKNGHELFELNLRSNLKKGVLLMHVDSVNDRNAAEALKGTDLFIPRHRLPELEEDEFYNTDLLGLKVFNTNGEDMGIIKAVQNFGASDLLEIQPSKGRSYFLPFTREIVPIVDITGGRIVVDPPPGLIADASQIKPDDGDDG